MEKKYEGNDVSLNMSENVREEHRRASCSVKLSQKGQKKERGYKKRIKKKYLGKY